MPTDMRDQKEAVVRSSDESRAEEGHIVPIIDSKAERSYG
jgi:hypothetical protein